MTIDEKGVCAPFDETLIGQPAVLPGRASIRYLTSDGNGASPRIDRPQRSLNVAVRRPHPLFSESRTCDGPPPPDLFVREDVRKDENRVNLALFSLM